MALTFSFYLALDNQQMSHPPQLCYSRPEVKTKPIHLGDHIILLCYLFLLDISHKQKCAGTIGLYLYYYEWNGRYLEESRGVTDFSPLIPLEYCSIQWIPNPPPPPCPFGEVNCPPRPFPLLMQLLCMGPSQQAGAPAAAGDANLQIPHTVKW